MGSLPHRLYRSDVEDTYLRKFVEEGEIFFRPLTHFRTVEDPVRRDENEGVYEKNAAGLKLEIDFHGSGKFAHAVNMDHGAMKWSTKHADQIHIYCFSLCPQPSFGSSTLKVFDVPGLLTHMGACLASSNFEVRHGPVNYYDDTLPPSGGLPDNVWLEKRKKYSHEQEYRIAFFVKRRELYQEMFPSLYGGANADIPKHIKARVGNLSQFSRLLPEC